MWALYTIISVLMVVIANIGYKYILEDAEPLAVALIINIFVLLALAPFAIKKIGSEALKKKKIIFNRTAAAALLIGGVLDALAFFLLLKAYELGDFSVVTPIRNITPLFSLFLGTKMLKEKAGPYVIIGTFLLTFGIIIISATQNFAPEADIWRKIFSAPSLLALAVAFLSALIVIANKYGVGEKYGGMNPLLYTASTMIIGIICYSAALLFTPAAGIFKIIAEYWQILIILGVFSAAASWSLLKAYSTGNVIQISPLFRSQVLLGVILGGAFFSEEYILIRLAGAVILFMGIILIVVPAGKKFSDSASFSL